jgi:NAD(P)H-nitrite reductase large subunit
VGNGPAAINAAEEIRRMGSNDEIVMISKEVKRPYSRVLLPYHLRGKLPDENQMFIRDEDFYVKEKISFINDEVVDLDTQSQKIHMKNRDALEYDRLLIATGSSPFVPPIEGLSGKGIHSMWTLEDARDLRPYFVEGKSILILGSGFVSLQAAWAAIVKGLNVYVYELMPRVMGRVLDEQTADRLTEQMEKFGVDVRLGASTRKVEHLADGRLRIHADDMEPIEVDFMIVGTGVRPNTQFLKKTKVNHERGIAVDHQMRTNVKNVFAAGDVAAGPTAFGEQMIHALWPTAVEEGKIAASNMLGKDEDFTGSLNMNVTQMFDITVASMGQFIEAEGQDVWEYDLDGLGNFKLVLEEGIPVGASLLGKSELVEYLGILRPIIRKKQTIKCEKSEFFQYLRREYELI